LLELWHELTCGVAAASALVPPHAHVLPCCAQACNWTYSSDVALSPDRKLRATLVQRYHFSSNLRRMSAVVSLEDSSGSSGSEVTHWAVMKGAPEVVRGFLRQVRGGGARGGTQWGSLKHGK
jgi:magnesium-transporting ATPase (P-type)